ncbi:glutamyl-tRNA reductase [Butyricicoccus sp. Marseille-Q5471]|uniref:glutamyl-tRNA reductase n=1 Tax=Butyricicoccus sp. Marseille-Q5471 TaxID=3039493 RepID=UPI0024BCE737|nr:glutamyl-tRNA reductase [Butyricicoccus sp. Marseille-Q5471]
MNLYMVGIDFQRASIAQREPVSFTRGQVVQMLPRLKTLSGVSGCVLLATCNRTELYLHTDGSQIDPLTALATAAGVSAEVYRSISVTRTDSAVVEHLMTVAAGLESQIFGDDQIVSQVKDAVALAREADAADSVLGTVFRRAVTAGKRVKTETHLAGVPASAADSGVRKAEALFGSLEGRHAVVIGNGEMGRLAASLLRQKGCRVTVTLRTYRHGETVVPAGCATHPYEERFAVVDGADLVFSATTSPHFTITAAQVAALKHPPRLLVDLAMPRDIEASAAEDGCFTVWNLDDLGQLGDENASNRAIAACILKEEQAEFEEWYRYRQSLPLIASLKDAARERVQYDHAYEALYEENDVDGLLELAVNKTVDMLLGGMKEIVSPDRMNSCLGRMRKGCGK